MRQERNTAVDEYRRLHTSYRNQDWSAVRTVIEKQIQKDEEKENAEWKKWIESRK